jgi:hypothetical protein
MRPAAFHPSTKTTEAALVLAGLGLWFFLVGCCVVVKHIEVRPDGQAAYNATQFCFLWQDSTDFHMPVDGSWVVQTNYLYGFMEGPFRGGSRGSSHCF